MPFRAAIAFEAWTFFDSLKSPVVEDELEASVHELKLVLSPVKTFEAGRYFLEKEFIRKSIDTHWI